MLMKMLVKKLEMATLLTGKVDFRAKKITREEVHYILRQWSIHQEDVMIPNTYASRAKSQNTWIQVGKTESINRKSLDYNWSLQHHFLSNC